MSFEVIVLFNGYSRIVNDVMEANCSCSLITRKDGPHIIVDTMTVIDKENIIQALRTHNLSCEDITHVISTHGHSDHVGNNNLFPNAFQFVGNCLSKGNVYYINTEFPYSIHENIQVIPTPGHTLECVSVLVSNTSLGNIAIVGDLFEKEEDIEDPNIWKEAGSQDPDKQQQNRQYIAKNSDWIIPGHGAMFKLNEIYKQLLNSH